MNINILLFIILITYFILKPNYPKLRGKYGEKWVRKELEKLPKNEYYILNDIMIVDEKGSHQIDHIVISKKGIFVIEMKNYYGLIVGNQYHEKWIQYLGKNKTYFYNPIRQNYGHIKTLSSLLNLNDNNFISIICFSNQAKLSIKTNNIVINLRNLRYLINDYNNEIAIDLEECKNKIIEKNVTDKNLRKQHIKSINRK